MSNAVDITGGTQGCKGDGVGERHCNVMECMKGKFAYIKFLSA